METSNVSIGVLAMSEGAVAAQLGPNSNGQSGKPPPKRIIVAASDVVSAPEPR